MSTSAPTELTDADLASIPLHIRFTVMDVRRERDKALAECDSVTKQYARLKQDYDTIRAELDRISSEKVGVHTETKELVALREEDAALEQQLPEARQNVEVVNPSDANTTAALEEEREKMLVDANGKAREMANRLEKAESSAREAIQSLERARRDAKRSRQHLEAERDKARAERDNAIADRNAALTKTAKTTQLTPEAAQVSGPAPTAFNDVTEAVSSQPAEPEPGPVQDDDTDPNWLTPPPENFLSDPKPTLSVPRTDVIDLSLDSDDEIALASPARVQTAASTTDVIVKTEPKASPSPSTSRNATPGPGPSTLQSRTQTKRPVDDIADVEPPKSAKRLKMLSNTSTFPGTSLGISTLMNTSDSAPSFDYGSTRKLLNALPASLNQRVANVATIELVQTPAHKLPTDSNPTIGWVKRELFEKKYSAWPMKMNNKLENIPVDPDTDLLDRYPTLFARLDMNPGLPTYPGRPGTLICSRPDVELGVPLYLIVASLKSTWHFVGQVILRRHERPVTSQEWKAMPTLTRNGWAGLLTKTSQFEAYQRLSIRIALSAKRNGPISDEELKRGFDKYVILNKPKSMLPTKADVLRAFDHGWATLDVLTIEPVAVNEGLYEEIWDHHLAGDYSKVDKSKKSKATAEPKVRRKAPTSSRSTQSVTSTSTPANATPSVRRSARSVRPAHRYTADIETDSFASDDPEEEEADENGSDSDFEDADD